MRGRNLRIDHRGKRFMKKMDCRIESGNDGNAGRARHEVCLNSSGKI
jgi:hypothetical protein